jgi:hypothetical protein
VESLGLLVPLAIAAFPKAKRNVCATSFGKIAHVLQKQVKF